MGLRGNRGELVPHITFADVGIVLQAILGVCSTVMAFLLYKLYKKQDMDHDDERSGRVHDRVEEHEREISTLQDEIKADRNTLNAHLIECARQHATATAMMLEVKEGQQQLRRIVEQLQFYKRGA